MRDEEAAHRELLNECVSYFRNRSGFERAFAKMKEKWRSYESIRGTADLTSLSEAERTHLGGFFGKVLPQDRFRFRLASFEEQLQTTRYAGIRLEELLEAYFDEPLQSRKMEQAKRIEEQDTFFAQLRADAEQTGSPAASAWVAQLQEAGYARLLRQFECEEDCRDAVRSVSGALSVIERLKEPESIPLSVLAMDLCSDPHGFDRDSARGRLLLKALEFRMQREPVHSAEEQLALYIDCHLRPDDISSYTVMQGIRLMENGVFHPAYEGFLQKMEYCLVSLSQLRTVTSALPVKKTVFIIENQMVYSRLCSECRDASLICTSGQLKTASLLLIDLLCQSDAEIFYSGDIDPEGMLIAQNVITRSHGKIRPWRMGEEEYLKSCSESLISDSRLRMLDKLRDPVLKKTAESVRIIRKAGYQERLLDDLISDIRLAG